jgi:hypothetical protein
MGEEGSPEARGNGEVVAMTGKREDGAGGESRPRR